VTDKVVVNEVEYTSVRVMVVESVPIEVDVTMDGTDSVENDTSVDVAV
jgi:hypothetical protein